MAYLIEKNSLRELLFLKPYEGFMTTFLYALVP